MPGAGTWGQTRWDTYRARTTALSAARDAQGLVGLRTRDRAAVRMRSGGARAAARTESACAAADGRARCAHARDARRGVCPVHRSCGCAPGGERSRSRFFRLGRVQHGLEGAAAPCAQGTGLGAVPALLPGRPGARVAQGQRTSWAGHMRRGSRRSPRPPLSASRFSTLGAGVTGTRGRRATRGSGRRPRGLGTVRTAHPPGVGCCPAAPPPGLALRVSGTRLWGTGSSTAF